MFFFFSKILEFFIYPFSWIVVLVIAALIVKKPALKKRMYIIASVLLFIFSNPFIQNQFAKWWDVEPVPLKKTGGYSCAIVLGGFSSELTKGHNYFNGSADRFIQALKLFETGKVSHILVTGGNGNLIADSFRESDWVKTQLLEFKVPDSCIVIEDVSRNTIEDAAFTKPKLDSAHLQAPYILVTSAFHMRRSLQIFKKTKIDVIPYPCNYLAAHGFSGVGDLIPDPSVLATWDIYIKEVTGTLVNYLR
ncbi:MAG TPA: YdcF family protein [Mucilaginibacter sp.]|jgi:uncharacterized SAM-binding protein YcdF (DUF218 family)|nr:YdcF family protein [Mucilaginibacter sp.]